MSKSAFDELQISTEKAILAYHSQSTVGSSIDTWSAVETMLAECMNIAYMKWHEWANR